MEDKKDNYNCGHCICGACGCGGGMMGMHGGKHHMKHKIFLIIILIIVFCLGSQWGEMKGAVRSYHHYDSYGDYGMMGGRYNMMNDGNFEYKLFKNPNGAPIPSVPATPTAPVQ